MPISENLGELRVDLIADDKKFEAELRKIEKDADKRGKRTGKNFGDRFNRFGKAGFKKFERFARGFFTRIGRMASRTIKIGLVAAFAGATAAVFKFVSTSSKFETLQLRLEQLLGSAKKGAELFEKLVTFSARTPFRLDEIVEASATLEAFGANAEALIKPVGDLAAFMNIKIPEAAAAFGRAFAAGAGAADILRERGVLNLVKMQEKINDVTKLTLPDFRRALIRAMVDPSGRIAGGTQKLAGTLAGKWSTLMDNLDQVFKIVGDSMKDNLIDKMQDWTDAIQKFISDGKVDELARRVGAALESIIGWIDRVGKWFDKWLEGGTIGDTFEDMRKTRRELAEIMAILKRGDSLDDKQNALLRILRVKPGDQAAIRAVYQETVNGIKRVVAAVTSGRVKMSDPKGRLFETEKRPDKKPELDLDPLKDIDLGAGEISKPLTPFVSNAVAQMKVDHIRGLLQEGLEGMDEDQAAAQKKNEKRLDDALSLTENAFDAFFSTVIRLEVQTNNRLVQGFVAMANVFISEIARMAAKWLAFKALQAGFGAAFGIPIPLGIPSAKHGADFINSANIQGESALLRTGAGERVRVTPRGQVGQEAKAIAELTKQFQIFALNQEEGGGQPSSVAAEVNITRRQIQLMVRQSNRREARFRGVGGISES